MMYLNKEAIISNGCVKESHADTELPSVEMETGKPFAVFIIIALCATSWMYCYL